MAAERFRPGSCLLTAGPKAGTIPVPGRLLVRLVGTEQYLNRSRHDKSARDGTID